MTPAWLCEANVMARIEHARDRASVEMLEAAARHEVHGDSSELLHLEGSDARIPVVGVLTKKPDFFAKFFGGGNTTYSSLQRAVMSAAGNPQVRRIVLEVDSQGGNVDGLFETLDLLDDIRRTSGKKMVALAENAQSAAYAIAAAVGRIEARGRGATLGSIGTAVSYWLSDNVVTLTNSDSPDKRPDLRTAEGKAVVVKYLDQINDVFVAAIARGRGVGAAKVREGYGRGASFTAERAIELGLVDSIQGRTGSGSSTTPAAPAAPRFVFVDMATATRISLDAAKAFDQRQAERARAAQTSSREATPRAAPPCPGREWVRP